MLNQTITKENDALFVTLEGELDTLTTPGFNEEMEKVLPEVKEVSLDFKELRYISSAGLRGVLAIAQYLEHNDYPLLKIHNCSAQMVETFELIGFDQFVEFC